ncbi:hypothetical protein GCM10022384_47140 [Streptomyces marokkonensis]|uniref:Beta-xylosidase C-terminal Concanavalin A-like domain-containing protein n=1 Tax=Streptomyces marokkonensis TaxID=324855 RepID=A0ABP7R8U5_9ACTN
MLGRETALAPVTWTSDGWPRVPTGLPSLEVPGPTPGPLPVPGPVDGGGGDVVGLGDDEVDGFDQPALGPQWSTLRRPATSDWLSLTARPSHLRLHGGRSPQSLTGSSLVGRRVTSANGAFEVRMEYRPRSFQHLAGITAYYNTRTWYFLYVTADDEGRAVLRVAGCDRGAPSVDEAGGVSLGEVRRLRLGLDLRGPGLRFRYATDGDWHPVGPLLDATVLSDEHAEVSESGQIRALGFTGAFVGMWAWDLTGGGLPADFEEASWHAAG